MRKLTFCLNKCENKVADHALEGYCMLVHPITGLTNDFSNPHLHPETYKLSYLPAVVWASCPMSVGRVVF